VFKNAGLNAVVGNCTDKRAYDPTTGYAMVFSENNELIGKLATNADYEFTIQVLTKQSSQDPIDVMK
jgi:hypothetical protein